MVVASEEGPDKAAEALARLGVMRIATKYPRIATAYFEETGRRLAETIPALARDAVVVMGG